MWWYGDVDIGEPQDLVWRADDRCIVRVPGVESIGVEHAFRHVLHHGAEDVVRRRGRVSLENASGKYGHDRRGPRCAAGAGAVQPGVAVVVRASDACQKKILGGCKKSD